MDLEVTIAPSAVSHVDASSGFCREPSVGRSVGWLVGRSVGGLSTNPLGLVRRRPGRGHFPPVAFDFPPTCRRKES